MGEVETRTLDVLGRYCPIPVIEVRKIIRGLNKDMILNILTDDPESLHDIPALLKREGGELIKITNWKPIGWQILVQLSSNRNES